MILWTVDPFDIQKLCLLVGIFSATLGYLAGKYSQNQILSFLSSFLPNEEHEEKEV
ncbi:hypothetical protein [Methanosarcina barkeri]|uniref:hypothetical protein n=1 Tax=Methanosarcina barkeri TaxID=2208 RepID=UPI00003C683E|nr:hypothetical protein [Methanosarcina barkeri]